MVPQARGGRTRAAQPPASAAARSIFEPDQIYEDPPAPAPVRLLPARSPTEKKTRSSPNKSASISTPSQWKSKKRESNETTSRRRMKELEVEQPPTGECIGLFISRIGGGGPIPISVRALKFSAMIDEK